MPNGTVKWVDPRTGEGRIRRFGREYPVKVEDMEPAARVPHARVHFDIRRDRGVLRAANVTLRVGKRVSHHQHRFGDLVGATRPDTKGRPPLTHRHTELDIDTGLQPMRVVRAWLDAMIAGDLPTALRLYAPDACLYSTEGTLTGRRGIEMHLAFSPLLGLRAQDVEIWGEDSTIVIRWERAGPDQPGGRTRLRIEHGQIAEQWL